MRLALDDFGTGYSSLSYLHSLPLDILKIAKPFVDRLGEGSQDSFVRMMIDLARSLDLEVIAEGIETAEQVEALRDLQSRFGQGFYPRRPGRRGAPTRPLVQRPSPGHPGPPIAAQASKECSGQTRREAGTQSQGSCSTQDSPAAAHPLTEPSRDTEVART